MVELVCAAADVHSADQLSGKTASSHMTRSDVEVIARSALRQDGIGADGRRIAPFFESRRIEIVVVDGRPLISACNSQPQQFRRAVITALETDG